MKIEEVKFVFSNEATKIDKIFTVHLTLGGVHKLRLQNLSFFDHLPQSVYIFYGMKFYKK